MMIILGGFLYLTALCSQCGPTVDPSTTQAIIRVESGGNPFAIGDGTAGKSYFPKSKTEAVRLAAYLLSLGHNIDMGLMQINCSHLGSEVPSLEAVFDPCENIKSGTDILSEFYRRFDNRPDRNEVLFKALSAYNTGSAWKGPAYVNRILRAAGAPYRVAVINSPKKRQSGRTGEAGAAQYAETAEESSLFFTGGNLTWNQHPGMVTD